MKLSIITINYNNAEGLRKTLASVAAQTYPNIEHIIVDGNSTDGSVDVIREYESTLASSLSPLASRLKWLSEPDKGIYNAMNKGIEIALGKRVVNDDHTSSPIANNQLPIALTDYIQILNSGDILAADDVTERMFQAMGNRQWAIDNETNSQSPIANRPTSDSAPASSPLASSLSPIENGPAIFYGNMIKEYPDGRRMVDRCQAKDYTPESFYYFYRGTLNHDCAYIRRDLFEKYGLYNEEMKICSDWEWYVRAIVLGGEKTVYTNIDVTVFDMTGISESNGKNKDIILKERREYLESILPAAVLRDYDMFSLPIEQYRRLKKYHLWGVVYFVERILFKLEKWFKK
jgi:glycosyltransferase involved in cell wall biosynthesis